MSAKALADELARLRQKESTAVSVVDEIHARIRATKELHQQEVRRQKKAERAPGGRKGVVKEHPENALLKGAVRERGRPNLTPPGVCRACAAIARTGRASTQHTRGPGCSRA